MARYRSDLRDIEFNLFELLNCSRHVEGFEKGDFKEVLKQFDKYVEAEIFPCRQEGDEKGVELTSEGVKAPESFKRANRGFYENGWFALGYPEEIGGMPAPESLSLACTSLAVGANVAYSMYFGLSKAALNVILKVGSDQQKQQYVPKFMDGTWGGTMCLTEPGAGSDVGAVKTQAKKLDDASYAISGVKIFISSGESDLYENNIHMVLARTPGAPEGTKGISLFIVPRFKINEDGTSGQSNHVKCTKIEKKMGIHGSATCEMTFEESQGFLIGNECEGMKNMFIMMNEARLLCGMQGEAQANLATLMSYQYARERSQFSKEIKNLPDVKRLLFKMRAASRGMRALNLYVGDLFDEVAAGENKYENEVALLTPICKSYESEEGFNVCVDAIQVHGGYGYCSEYGIEQFVRDTKIATIYEGTNAIQSIDFVLRKILKDEAKTFKILVEKIQTTLKAGNEKFPQEVKEIQNSLSQAKDILDFYALKAGQKNYDEILFSAQDFLNFCAHLVVSWRLLEGALKASELMDCAQAEEREFYESKLTDFKVYTQHFLIKNRGIAAGILNFGEDLTSLEL